jgi:hypothetical protein
VGFDTGLGAARSWGLAPGGAIVLVGALVFGVASVLTAGRGRLVRPTTDGHVAHR